MRNGIRHLRGSRHILTAGLWGIVCTMLAGVMPACAELEVFREEFEQEPIYGWVHQSDWGDQHATWDRPETGAVGKCLRATHSTGDCKDNRGFVVTDLGAHVGHLLRIRVQMTCPTGSGKFYWMETSFKTFDVTPLDPGTDYDTGSWTKLHWFDGDEFTPEEPDGNDDTWTEYSATFILPVGQPVLAVGFETGSIDGTGGAPTMRWDSLIVVDLDAGPPASTPTPSATSGSNATQTPTVSVTASPTRTSSPTFTGTQATVTNTPVATDTPTDSVGATSTFTPTTTTSPTITATASPTETNCEQVRPQFKLSTGTDNAYTPDISIDGYGRAHVVWRGSDWKIWYTRIDFSYWPSLSRLEPIPLAGPGLRDPKVVADASGEAHVIARRQYADEQDFLTYMKVTSYGTLDLVHSFQIFPNWPVTGEVTDQKYSWPSIAYDPINSRPVIAAQVHLESERPHFPGSPVLIWYFRDSITTVPLDAAGNPITSERRDHYSRLTSSLDLNEPAQYPDIVVDSLGAVHTVWKHHETEWGSTYHSYAANLSTNSPPQWFETYPGGAFTNPFGGPKAAAGINGYFETAFTDRNTGTVMHQRLSHGNSIVGPTLPVSASETTYAKSPDIGAGDGVVVAAWTDDGGGGSLYTRRVHPLEPVRLITECGPAYNVALDVRSSTSADFVWQDGRFGYDAIYYTSLDFTEGKANLIGIVGYRDDHGRYAGPVEDARVEIRNTARTQTNSNGYYEFFDIDAGDYVVSASKEGLKRQTYPITLHPFETAALNFTLIESPTKPYFLKYLGLGNHFVPDMPGEWNFTEVVDFNDQGATTTTREGWVKLGPTGARFATIKPYSLDPIYDIVEVKAQLPEEIDNCYQAEFELTNQAGIKATSRTTWFHPLPESYEDFAGEPNWSQSFFKRHKVYENIDEGYVLFKFDLPPLAPKVSIQLDFNRAWQLEFDSKGGQLTAAGSGAVKPSVGVEISEIGASVAGEGGFGQKYDSAFNGCTHKIGSRSWSIYGKPEVGLDIPVVLVADLIPGAAVVVHTLLEVPIIKDIIGGLKVALSKSFQIGIEGIYETGVPGTGFLGTSRLNGAASIGVEIGLKYVLDPILTGVGIAFTGSDNFEVMLQPRLAFTGRDMQVGGKFWYQVFGKTTTKSASFKIPLYSAPKNWSDDLVLLAPTETSWRPVGESLRVWGPANRLIVESAKSASASPEVLVDNVQMLASPFIVVTTDGVHIFYSLYNENAPDDRATGISRVHRVSDNWQTEPVSTDQQADFGPVAIGESTSPIVLAWSRIPNDDPIGQDPFGAFGDLEVVVSRLEPGSSAWSTISLTDNSLCDRSPSPVLTESLEGVLWVQNAGSEAIGNATSGDRLLFSEWVGGSYATPVTVWDSGMGIFSYVFCSDATGTVHLVAEVDTDGVVDTEGDRELYRIGREGSVWGAPVRLTNDAMADRSPVLETLDGVPMVAWIRDNQLLGSDLLSFAGQPLYGTHEAPLLNTPVLKSEVLNDTLVLAYLVSDVGGSDIALSAYAAADRVWSPSYRVTRDGDAEVSPSLAVSDDRLALAYVHTSTVYAATDIVVDGTPIHFDRFALPGPNSIHYRTVEVGPDLAIRDEGIGFTPPLPLPGEPTLVEAVVQNVGLATVSDVTVGFYDGDPAEGALLMATDSIVLPLNAGMSVLVSATCVLPDDLSPHRVFVYADPFLQTNDIDRENNTGSRLAIAPDLEIVSLTTEELVPGESYVLTALVSNTGTCRAAPSLAELVIGQPTAEWVQQEMLGAIPAGVTSALSLWVDTHATVFSDRWMIAELTIDVLEDVLEGDETNNQSLVLLEVGAPESPTPTPTETGLTETPSPTETSTPLPTPTETQLVGQTPTPSTTQTPLGDERFDLVADQRIDAKDILLFLTYLEQEDSRADFNGDDVVDFRDLLLLSVRFHSRL